MYSKLDGVVACLVAARLVTARRVAARLVVACALIPSPTPVSSCPLIPILSQSVMSHLIPSHSILFHTNHFPIATCLTPPRSAPTPLLAVRLSHRPRLCVAVMSPSHNSSRALSVLNAISDSHISSHQTWCTEFPRGPNSPYYEVRSPSRARMLPDAQLLRVHSG